MQVDIGIIIITITIILAVGVFLLRRKFVNFILEKQKIKQKIILSFLTLFIMLILILAGFIFFISYKTIENNVENNLRSSAILNVSHLNTYFQQNIERLKLVTSRTALRKTLANYNKSLDSADLDTITGIIKDASISIEEFERVCVLSLEGVVLASTNKNFYGKDVRNEEFFLQGKIKEGIYFVEEEGVYKLFVSGPMMLENNLIGVGITVLSLDKLKSIIQNNVGLGKTGEILVSFYNKQGIRIYPIERLFENKAIGASFEKPQTAEPMKKALLGEETFFPKTIDYRDKSVLAFSSYIEVAKLGFVAKIDRFEAFFPLWILSLTYLLITGFFIFIFYLISIRISNTLVSSLERMKLGIKNIERGEFKYDVKIDGNDEVAELSNAFDKMILEVEKSSAEVDKKVLEQTQNIQNKAQEMADQQKATLNILEDVEEEKNKTKQEKDKIDAVLHSIGDGVFVVDKNLKVTIVNEVAAKMSGYEMKDILNKKYTNTFNFIFEDSKKINDKFITEAIKTKKIQEMSNHTVLIDKNGNSIQVDDSSAPLLDEDKNVIGCVVVFRDVTKERNIDKAKTEFVSLASHQLRTPLSAIRWYLEDLGSQEIGKLNKQQKDYVESGIASTKRLIAIVNGLLNVSRLEMGRLTIDPKPINLVDLVKSVVSEHQALAKERKVNLKIDEIDKDIPKINLDQMLMRQVVANFVSNAIKYTKPKTGKPVIVVKINVDRDIVKVLVCDNGEEIPQKDQERLFLKFFRATSAVSSETDGTGLGLYIAKMIVESSGGQIVFESTNKKGTIFGFSMPLSGSKAHKGETTLSS